MDKEQEHMQFLGLFGIFKQCFKIIISWKKIFTQITLTLILPLALIFLAHLEIWNTRFQYISQTKFETPFTDHDNKSELVTFLLFEVVYIIISLILYLLSTSAVVYTVACVYTQHKLTFKEVMSVVPKVWKKIMVAFLCLNVVSFVYTFLASFVMLISFYFIPYPFKTVLLFVVLIIYVIGLGNMTVCWQLASVVSVLESPYGFKAMKKSKDLIKGNQMVAVLISLLLSSSFYLIKLLFESFVVHESSLEVWKRVGVASLCCMLLLFVFLFGLVTHTILYLVCKSYHHENIDKGDLSDHLESYLGDYEPLSGEDVQPEKYQV